MTYIDTPGALSVETQRLDGAGQVWADSVDLYDGLFHTRSHSSANGEATSWNRIDTCYDGYGRVRYSVYPYQSSSAAGTTSCSGSHDTYDYDALGRPTALTHSDSSAIATTYAGRATDVRDEGNGSRSVERITQADALGRLTNVCEVTSQSQAGQSPSNCGLDFGGTGFLTSYSYNGRGDLTTVAQGALSRNFQYDFLSRLQQASNPEAGPITYAYDSDSNCTAQPSYSGELISKTDARGVRTCFTHDALHRLTGKTYNDGTPAVTYGFDEGSRFGRTLTNTVGRMSSESTAAPNPTGSVFSYDELGHVIDNSQCTPQNCTGSAFPITYTGYNVLGEPGYETDGMSHTYAYGYKAGGNLAYLTSSLNDGNHPGTLFNSAQYNAFGSILSSSIGSAPLVDSRQYNDRGRLTSISVTDSSATQSTGTVTITGGEQSGGGPTHSTGSVTIYGEEQSGIFCDDAGLHCHTYHDTGTVTVKVNGYSSTVSYGAFDTATTVAANLASSLNGGTLVTASANGTVISLTSRATGASTNYTLSVSAATTDYVHFDSASFGGTPSGPTLTGGSDTSAPYDTGTVTVSVNGSPISVSYGQSDTSSSVASSLSGAINANSPSVTASVSGNVVTLTSRTSGAYTNYALSASNSSSNGFNPPSFTPSPSGGTMTGGTGGSIYSLGMSYYANGDVQSASDSVNGNWTYTYDDFNRLNTAASNGGLGCAEVYDRFGNRLQQNAWNGTCYGPQYTVSNNNNRIDQFTYDAAGNVLGDGYHTYTYDAENRITAVDSGSTATFVYDAESRRARKTGSGGTFDFLYDLAGHVISEVNSSGGWNRGEIYAGSAHLATYANGSTYFTHADWLGTERVRSNLDGSIYSIWTSYPFGEGSSAPNPGPTHFTGKERDSESGLDYFGARYYGSNMGRWMSPDPINLTNDRLFSPANTLNKYAYSQNNPLTFVDPDGEDAVLFYDPSGIAGHVMLLAYNQQTGDFAIEAYGPAGGPTRAGEAIQLAGGQVDGTDDYKLPQSADDLRKNYASLTIQTTPEVAQDMINKIRSSEGDAPKNFNAVYGKNCSTACSDVLKELGIGRHRTPAGLWAAVMGKYGQQQSWFPFFSYGRGTTAPHQTGAEYGRPRNGINGFDLLWLLLKQPKATVTVTTCITGPNGRRRCNTY